MAEDGDDAMMEDGGGGPGPLQGFAEPLTLAVLEQMLRSDAASFRLDPAALHLRHRLVLVEWIMDVCNDEDLSKPTANLAILYCDRVLSTVKVPRASLQLVALCCILIAAKFTEPEVKVPTVPALIDLAGGLYNVELVGKMESALLAEMGWKLFANTPAHFLEAFVELGTDAAPGAAAPTEETARYLVWYHDYFLRQCWQDPQFSMLYTPATIAAAVMHASRRRMVVSPAWPPHLVAVTGMAEATLTACSAHILNVYNEAIRAADAAAARAEVAAAGGVGGTVAMAAAPATPDGGAADKPAHSSPSGPHDLVAYDSEASMWGEGE